MNKSQNIKLAKKGRNDGVDIVEYKEVNELWDTRHIGSDIKFSES